VTGTASGLAPANLTSSDLWQNRQVKWCISSSSTTSGISEEKLSCYWL